MPPSTQILQFDSGMQNLQPQANYAGSAIQLDGFTAGVVDPTVLNIILQQSSFMASGLANWMVAQGISVPNDGNMTNLINEISEALVAFVTNGGTGPVGYFQIYAGNPNGHVAGAIGVGGTTAPSMVWDTVEKTFWICTTTGTTSTAVWSRNSLMQVYAGNPNGLVAGTAGAAGGASPSFICDVTNNILWMCTVTGSASTAVWIEIGQTTPWPYWCGTSTGSANAQVVTPPAAMQSLVAGSGVVFIAGFTNGGDTTLQIGSLGTPHFVKDGPTGPVLLTGGEIVAGNKISATFDGTYLQLTATELGTAALANASSNTGTVAAVSGAGSINIGHIAVFSDASGTVVDGGVPGAAGAPSSISASTTLGPGRYLVDTRGGPITITLSAALVANSSIELIDAAGSWSINPVTVVSALNFKTSRMTTPQPGPLVCNVAGLDFILWNDGTNLEIL